MMVPMLPTASATRPPSRRSAVVSVVVVVFPLVPVMPTQLAGLSRQANSGSPIDLRRMRGRRLEEDGPHGDAR